MYITQTDLKSRATINILLALALKPRHGYELMQQIEEDTGGRMKLGPGGLYANLTKLNLANLIEEMPFEGSRRRRYYRLTKKGWDQLSVEMKHLQRIVQLAQYRLVL